MTYILFCIAIYGLGVLVGFAWGRSGRMTREEHIAWLKAIKDSISGGDEEFDNKRRKSLDAGISALLQEPCERFEWGIDGNVYKITKAKDGKEICQQVCDDAISQKENSL